ncbi:MAG TPA: phosphotransferase, partial [Rhodocyclaceae bacterium]|nr:phosphotransferase [Rhodocyclaceae bacterium]
RRLPNPRGAAWRAQAAQRLLPVLDAAQAAQLGAELEFQRAQDYTVLPQGIVHADLFRDNVLWEAGRLSGILDFYFAGEDALLFDLAVAANDWCSDAQDESALLDAYERERPLQDCERAAWGAMRRAAALRFWLSRLEDVHYPRPGALVTVKDPAHFGAMLARMVNIP